MKDSNNPKTNYSFFAAANSYDGFVSYFDQVFNPREFTKIFVLKGGPGTGKSTLMKKIAKYAEDKNYHYEAIWCSSDVNSLDGIIIYSNGKKIAVLDGTAPHERDAILPGAVDELINLGEAWRENCLQEKRAAITDLNAKKARYYTNAYNNMHYSSIFGRKIKAEIGSIIDVKKADQEATKLVRDVYKEGISRRGIRLISSFSKDGYRTLNTLEDIADKVIYVSGKYGSAEIFLNLLRANLQKTDTDYTIFPSPLDKNSIEAIYIEKTKTAIIARDTENADICTLELLDKNALEAMKDDLIDYGKIKDFFLNKAKDALGRASNMHFELEAIYTPCMDFLLLGEYADIITDKCNKVFQGD